MNSFKFKVHVRCAPSMPRVYELYRYVPGSYYIHVGSKTLEVHQEVLRKISSYYRSYLVARKNMLIRCEASDIDSDYNAVKATIDFAYGREVKNKSFDGYVSIYRFANELRLDAVTDELDKYFISNLSIDTISTVMQCMYDANEKVHPRCIQYFKDHEADVKKTEKFLQLSQNTVIHVLKKAFQLETNADVLRHASNNRYEFVMNKVEQCLLKSLTLAEFCDAVSYAWERDRDDIKQACAKFCKDNLAEVMKLDAFFELPTKTIGGVMKLAHDLNREGQ